jgi:Xaa-Pro dipeptidase
MHYCDKIKKGEAFLPEHPLSEEIKQRIGFLKENMNSHRIDACMIMEKVNFYYYTGTTVEGSLYVEREKDPLLFIRKPVGRAEMESPLQNIHYFHSMREIGQIVSSQRTKKIKTFGLELDVLPFSLYQRISDLFSGSKIEDISELIKEQRAVKSDYELDNMKKAFTIIKETLDYGQKILKSGMTEVEFSALLEGKAKSLGHQGISRMRRFNQEASFGHIVSGNNNNIPCTMESANGGLGPYPAIGQGASFTKIKKNQPIMVDVLGGYNGYLIDITRIFVIGDLDKELKEAFKKTKEILNKIKKMLKPGEDCHEIYQKGMKIAEDMGILDTFMGPPKNQVEFIGHGVGLELDEIPVLMKNFSYQLKENNTIAVEPKIFLPEKGIVVIENTFQVTKQGGESLTDYPETIIQVNP